LENLKIYFPIINANEYCFDFEDKHIPEVKDGWIKKVLKYFKGWYVKGD
jgi:hypothetical protein